MLLIKICELFNQANIPYAIVGGHAVALHGAARGTVDIDVVIRWELETLKKVEQLLKSFGMVSRIPLQAEKIFQNREDYIKNKNLIAWNFYSPTNPLDQVDLIISYDLGCKKVDECLSSNVVIKILNKMDLIAMKELSGRNQDLEDIQRLKKL